MDLDVLRDALDAIFGVLEDEDDEALWYEALDDMIPELRVICDNQWVLEWVLNHCKAREAARERSRSA